MKPRGQPSMVCGMNTPPLRSPRLRGRDVGGVDLVAAQRMRSLTAFQQNLSKHCLSRRQSGKMGKVIRGGAGEAVVRRGSKRLDTVRTVAGRDAGWLRARTLWPAVRRSRSSIAARRTSSALSMPMHAADVLSGARH